MVKCGPWRSSQRRLFCFVWLGKSGPLLGLVSEEDKDPSLRRGRLGSLLRLSGVEVGVGTGRDPRWMKADGATTFREHRH